MQFDQLQLNAMMKASTEASEREHHETRELLRKYFKRSRGTEALYYYMNKGKKVYYNIIEEKRDLFEKDVQELGKEHVRMHIKMIDKRTEDYKTLLSLIRGYYMENLNFTFFDMVDNIFLSDNYGPHLDVWYRDMHNCTRSWAVDPNEKIEEEKELTEEEKKKEEEYELKFVSELLKIAKHINIKVNDKGKEDIKKIRYGPDIGIGEDWERKVVVYLGCEVSLDTNMNWMYFYRKNAK